MTPAEVASRSRQEALKRLERAGALDRIDAVRRARSAASPMPDPRDFFSGAVCGEVPRLLAARLPDECKAVIASADDACAGRFDLLGCEGLSFGDPIDWHLDPIARIRAPLLHWSRLDVLDRTQVGDSKVPWELNRHQWLVWLGQAYRLTGDQRYEEAFLRAVREWLEANPRGRGINWASSLELGLRLIAWLWALFLFAGAAGQTPEFVDQLLESVVDHAAHIERYMSHYYSPNTHLTGEALGLLYAGLVLPAGRRTRRWREQGMRILVEQCEHQIADDGAYFEQSTGYQRYTVEIYLQAMILADRHGVQFPRAVSERIQRSLDYLLWVCAPNGSMPAIGDADGGWLLPFVTRKPDDVRGVFSTAAAWFHRADYAEAAGGAVAVETLWLLGAPGLRAFDALHPSSPAEAPSRLFPRGGTAVMRASWRRDSHQLLFDVGSLNQAAHAHADLLSAQCAVFGEPCLVDAGTYCYTADARWRDFFRGTTAHSTMTIDGLDQAAPDRPFRWSTQPGARLRRWESSPVFDYADAEHQAYLHLPDPVVHRRRLLFVKPRFWVLVDDLGGAAEHRLDLRFQLAPSEVTLDASPWARARRPSGRGLLICALSSVPLATDVNRGHTDPPAGWVSPDYGIRTPAPTLVYSTRARLPVRIATLLLPVQDASGPPPTVSVRFDASGAINALDFQETGESIRIDDDRVWAQADASIGAR